MSRWLLITGTSLCFLANTGPLVFSGQQTASSGVASGRLAQIAANTGFAPVPNLTGKTIVEATEILRQVKLVPGRVERRPSNRPSGTVISQSPRHGEMVSIGASVDFVVAIPQGAIHPITQATGTASPQAAGGAAAGEMADYGSGQTAPTNTQVRPPKEKQARQGSSFWNTVGQSLSQAMTSDAPQGVRVPKLVSRTRKEAVQLLERAELRLGEETSEPSDKPAGTVLGQSRKAGSRVPAGTFVNIVLARARPSEAPGASSVVPSSPPFIVVPNLDGESFERARKRLSDIGLTTGAVSYRKSKSPPGTVVGQDPAPGRRVAPGSGVALSVSPPNLTPGLSADRTNPKKGDQVTFTISVPPKAARLSGLKYRVDFGDGQKSDWTGATRLVHTYGASGTFPARASSMLDTQETWDGAPLEISVAGSLPAGWFGAALAALAVLGALLRWLKRPTPDPQPFHPGLTVKARLGTDPGVQSIHSELPLVPLPAIGLHFSRGKSAVTIVPAYEHGLEQQGGRTHDEREDQG